MGTVEEKKRLEKIHQKCKTVKPNQIGVCRFVEIRVQTYEQDEMGKWIRTGMVIEKACSMKTRLSSLMVD